MDLRRQSQKWFAMVATEGDEVEVPGLLVTFETGRHGGTSSLPSHPSPYMILTIMRLRTILVIAPLFAGLLAVAQGLGAHKPVIVSTTYPKDSRGETVYDVQDETQKDAPIVPGILTLPVPLHRAKPRIPISSRMHHRKLDIIVEGVVSANGDMIDVHFLKKGEDSAMAQSVLDAYSSVKFKPATLDGKPVAVLLEEELKYNFF